MNHRQVQQLAALQQSWQLVFDTLSALRNSRHLETRVEEQRRMDALIQQKQADLADLDAQIQALESALPLNSNTPSFSGKAKLQFTQRLGEDWRNLADWLEIPLNDQRGFSPGDEARAIWAWLEVRNQLRELPGALREIHRDDLATALSGGDGGG